MVLGWLDPYGAEGRSESVLSGTDSLSLLFGTSELGSGG